MPSRPEAIFAQPAQFLTSSPDLAHLPETDMPEVAFAGRSNCGKSSLLNALMGVKNLARTSNTPGRTKLLNFFSIGKALMFVDLPGYGFARTTCAERAQWQQNWQAYIQKRTALRHVFVLIDSRRGLMPIDRNIMSGLDNAATSYSIVLTKADKIPTRIVEQTQTLIAETLTEHPAAWPFPLVCSAKKLQGIQELRQEILINIR
ncbi:MAG: YihA family ribosome biogenesis GTP-binding protein [Alphaproteobacteria bacterium]|nr:YihA family ribosome biogenesis GTP-binding protein [Alphaproteobacteria bacterium]